MSFFSLNSIIFLVHSIKFCINCAIPLWHFVDICLLQLCSQFFLLCFVLFAAFFLIYLWCVYRWHCVNSDDSTRNRKKWGTFEISKTVFFFHLNWYDQFDRRPSKMLIASLRIRFSFDFVGIFFPRFSIKFNHTHLQKFESVDRFACKIHSFWNGERVKWGWIKQFLFGFRFIDSNIGGIRWNWWFSFFYVRIRKEFCIAEYSFQFKFFGN